MGCMLNARGGLHSGRYVAVCLLFLMLGLWSLDLNPRFPNPGTVQSSAAAPVRRLDATYGKLPLSFEANQGQTDRAVKFLSRGRGYALFLTGDEAVLTLERTSQKAKRKSQKAKVRAGAPTGTRADLVGRAANASVAPTFRACPEPCEGSARAGLKSGATRSVDTPATDHGPRTTNAVLRMRLVGANASAVVTGADELPGKSNYFIGNDPKKWRTNVATYAKVKYHNVYPGVDLVYYGNQGGQLEYDFVVAPGADPSAIKLNVGAGLALPKNARSARTGPDGSERVAEATERAGQAQPLQIAPNGDLVIKIDGGEVRFHKPIVYQPDFPSTASSLGSSFVTGHSSLVEGHYVLQANHRVGFKVPTYDHTRRLVIDPVLSYSTYLGGSYNDGASGIAVDAAGSAYVIGSTDSFDFPTLNPFQATLNGSINAFVSKLNPAGSALVYSTFLGGATQQIPYGGFTADDIGNAIAVDASGSAYVTGYTSSPNFPTVNAFQPGCGPCGANNYTAFVAKLSPAGSALVYSTYLGGSFSEYSYGIAADAAGNAYVTGVTSSTDFPTVNAFQGTDPNGGQGAAAFVTKFNAVGSALVYSTYLGGSYYDQGNAIAVDASGSAYVTGATASTNFPTLNPEQAKLGGTNATTTNAFVTKFSPSGSALVYSTYLGGGVGDQGNGIAVDASGNAYVTGETTSSNFPTVNPFQSSIKGEESSFVAKLNAAGSALVYSTFLGGTSYNYGFGIAADASGNAYVTGETQSADFPTVTAVQPSYGGNGDAFVAELNAAGSELVYSTYLGGSNSDAGSGIAVDASGNAYVAGESYSTNFPTVNALQPTNHNVLYGGGFNAIIAKISPGNGQPVATPTPSSLAFEVTGVGLTSPPQTVTVTNTGTGVLTINNIVITGTNSNDFTETNTCGAGVAAGDNCAINVTFAPTLAGTCTAVLTFTDNGVSSPLTIFLTGSVQLSVALSTTILNFPPVTQPLTVTNNTAQPVVITSIQITDASGAQTVEFTYTSNCGSSLAVGASCVINVTYNFARGVDNAFLHLRFSGPNSPQTVALNVTGPWPVSVSPASLSFASQPVGTTSAAQSVTLTNYSSATLSIASFAPSGDFAITNNTCGATVLGSASCTFGVTFTPTAPGSRSGAITINDNAASSPQTVSLAGTGGGTPTLVITASSVSMAYGGAVPTITPSYSGFVNGDTVQSLTTQPTCSATATSSSPVGSYPSTCSGAVDSNYTISYTAGTVTIAAAPLIVTAGSASMTYGGAVPTITPTFAGSVNHDSSASLTSAPTCSTTATNSSPVGSYPSTCLGAVDTNYSITYTAGTVTIAPAPLTITAPSATISAGSAIPSFTPAYNGFVNGQTASSLTTQPVCTTTATNSSPAGSYPITCSGAVDANYTISYVAGILTITATGLQGTMSLSTTSLSFGNQVLNTTSGARSVTVTNTGTGPLNVSSVAASAEYAANSTCVSALNPGGACTVNVTFTPTALGTQTGTVTVNSNASNGPQVVNLTGNGFAGAALSCSNCVVGRFVVGSGGGEKIITLANAQNVALTNISISITGSNDYSQTNTCGTALGARQTCAITVTFTPSIVGVDSATLTVADSAANSPQTATLMGAGLASAGQAARSTAGK